MLLGLNFLQPVIALLLFYNGSEQEARMNFKHFYDLGIHLV